MKQWEALVSYVWAHFVARDQFTGQQRSFVFESFLKTTWLFVKWGSYPFKRLRKYSKLPLLERSKSSSETPKISLTPTKVTTAAMFFENYRGQNVTLNSERFVKILQNLFLIRTV